MTRVLNAIRQEHKYTGQLLALLSAELNTFQSGETPDYDLLFDILEYFRLFPDSAHHNMEDLVFDKLIAKPSVSRDSLIDLSEQHYRLDQITGDFLRLLERIKLDEEIEREMIVSVFETFIKSYRYHMVSEEQEFLPLAESHLTSKDWSDIMETISDLESPYVDKALQAKSDHLRKLITGIA